MTWRIDDPQGDEAGKVKFEIVQYTRGACWTWAAARARRSRTSSAWTPARTPSCSASQMRPDVTCDVSDPQAIAATFEPGLVDAIFSSHCLEHIEDYTWRAGVLGGPC
jgi:hypothetical protein